MLYSGRMNYTYCKGVAGISHSRKVQDKIHTMMDRVLSFEIRQRSGSVLIRLDMSLAGKFHSWLELDSGILLLEILFGFLHATTELFRT